MKRENGEDGSLSHPTKINNSIWDYGMKEKLYRRISKYREYIVSVKLYSKVKILFSTVLRWSLLLLIRKSFI